MNNQWKQPTPTDIRHNESVDLLSRLIFFDILNGCQNSEYHKVYYHGNKRVDIILERGQYLFNVSKYARELNTSRKTIQKCLRIISKWYTELNIERRAFGLIVTVKNYDELTKMNNEGDNVGTTKEQRSDNEVKSKNKSDKSEESEKTISKDMEKKSPYGNKDIDKFIEGTNKHLDLKLPNDGRARKTARNALQLFTKMDSKGNVKEGREFLKEDKWQNARDFMKCYYQEKISQGFSAQSWDKLYHNIKIWIANEGKLK